LDELQGALGARTQALPEPSAHDARLAAKAPLPQITPELRSIAATLLQAVFEIAEICVEGAGAACGLALRKASGTQPAPHRAPIETEFAGDLPLVFSLPREFHGLLIARNAPFAVVPLLPRRLHFRGMGGVAVVARIAAAARVNVR
jgi:hypothetical protein